MEKQKIWFGIGNINLQVLKIFKINTELLIEKIFWNQLLWKKFSKLVYLCNVDCCPIKLALITENLMISTNSVSNINNQNNLILLFPFKTILTF